MSLRCRVLTSVVCVRHVWCVHRDAERRRKDAKRNASTELSKDELHKMHPDPSLLEGLLIANQVCLSSAACKSDACKSVASAPLPAPSLPSFSLLTGRSLLRGLAGQVRSYCDSINNFSGQSLTKLYAVKGLQDKSLPAAGF